jgi:hypothetical protein
MSLKPGEYTNIVSSSKSLKWRHVKGEPQGVSEIMLHKHKDGSYTHLIRWEAGVEYFDPVAHDFYEEAYYISGEMLNKKTRKKITGDTYVFHKPGEEHGPSQ